MDTNIDVEDSGGKSNPALVAAVRLLCEELKKDMGYWISWRANIAMAFFDAYNNEMGEPNASSDKLHEISNTAAENFLIMLTRETKNA